MGFNNKKELWEGGGGGNRGNKPLDFKSVLGPLSLYLFIYYGTMLYWVGVTGYHSFYIL
jgi:hypothetical protein